MKIWSLLGSGFIVIAIFFIFNRRQDSLESKLQKAIEKGNTALAKSFIDQGADIKNKILGSTPLAWAVLWGNSELVQYLLERGSDISQRTEEGDLIKTAEFGKGEADEDEKARYDELIQFLKIQIAKVPGTF